MSVQESKRQQKVARQIQKDLSDIFIKEAAELMQGAMATVTVVRVTPDLSFARVYLSVFPFDKAEELKKRVEQNNWLIRKALGKRVRDQLRIVPELGFYIDNSLEYIQKIDDLIKG